MQFKSKFASLLAATLALGSFFALPAQATGSAATVTTTDITHVKPGQDITFTIDDAQGNFCANSNGAGQWFVRVDFVDDQGGTIFNNTNQPSVALISDTPAYTAGSTTMDPINVTISMPWLAIWQGNQPISYNGTWGFQLHCLEDPSDLVGDADGVTTALITYNYDPIVLASHTVKAGTSVSTTINDGDGAWCSYNEGAGFSAFVYLVAQDPALNTVLLPYSVANNPSTAFGPFTWNTTTTTFDMAIPADVVPGVYQVFVGCEDASFTPYNYMGDQTLLTVTAADASSSGTSKLANTGSAFTNGFAAGALVLIAMGGILVLRRRVNQ
jgi:LPXTG-motif cell wall-anchored protein